MSGLDIYYLLIEDGWEVRHNHDDLITFDHPTKPGRIIIKKIKGEIPPKTLDAIFEQAGLKPPFFP